VIVDLTAPAQASGVVYALGGRSGGVVLYLDRGQVVYEYNGLVVATTTLRSAAPLAAGAHRIEVETVPTAARPGAPVQLTLRIDGADAATATTPFSVPLTFTATESFDVGCDLGSSVSLAYFERAPFAFDGHIERAHVRYVP
jgi:arylsulfatase